MFKTWAGTTVLVLVGLFCVPVFGATELYVSPSGSDGNPGTREKPLRSVEKVMAILEAMPEMDKSGVTVLFDAGTYYLRQPMISWSHVRDRQITFKAAGAAEVVFSGGKVISGWKPHTGTIWKADVAAVDVERGIQADFRQLYVNGKRATRARGPFPAGGGRYGDLTMIDGDAGHIVPDEKMADWKNQSDIELGYFNSWSHMICKVKSITRDGSGKAKIAMQQPTFFLISRKEGVQARMPAYIENAYELLDEPGEWYFDKPNHTLYYMPRDGEDMATARVVAPMVGILMQLDGSILSPIENVRFEGITFADANWLEPSVRGHADVQANFTISDTNLFIRDNCVVALHNQYFKSPAHIRLRSVRNVAFDRCTFTRMGGAAIDVGPGSQNVVINGCRFFDISGSAVQVGDVQARDHHPDNAEVLVKNNRITDNYIHDIGVEYQDSVGIFCGYVNGTVIAHNEICNLPYSGMSVGWGWGEEDAGGGAYKVIPFLYSTPTPCGNNHIENNHIHDVMRLRNDGGGIYMLGNQPGTIIKGNHVHDNSHDPGGIYLDEGSGFIEITGNCVYNVKTPMNYNNRAQDRIKTCKEHDNYFGVGPDKAPAAVIENAGLEAAYRDLLRK